MTPKRFPPLCLGCNYPLEGLLGPRCPECGREFDLNNFRTFNWDRPLTWLDRKGAAEPLKLLPGSYRDPRISPDGKRLAFATDDGKEAKVWVRRRSL